MDTVIDELDFEEQFCDMTSSSMELDISVEKPAYFPDSIQKGKRCDYYQELHKEGELLVSFTSILVRMYVVNFVLNCLLELDLTLRDERILLDQVYTFTSDLMYEFLSTNYLFFMNFYFVLFKGFQYWWMLLWFFKAKTALWTI